MKTRFKVSIAFGLWGIWSFNPASAMACHDYGDAPFYKQALHNYQYYGLLGYKVDYEARNKPDYHDPLPEYDGAPDGDNYDDGVTSPTMSGFTWWVTPGEVNNLTFTARQSVQYSWAYTRGANNWINAWIDWDQDKQWEANEQILHWNGWVPELPNYAKIDLNVTVPTTFSGETWLRTRISNKDLAPTGPNSWCLAPAGEVEDYKVAAVPDAVIPEPTSLILLSSGLLGLLSRRRWLGHLNIKI